MEAIQQAVEDVVPEQTETEAVIGNTATFIRADGSEGVAAEIWVSSDLFDTVDTADVEISDDIAELPEL